MSTYRGMLDVEPNLFPMKAERVILRNDEIAFHFQYREAHGYEKEWSIDDIATRQAEGYYKCNVTDPTSGYEPDQATIYILRVQAHRIGCFIEGFWHEKAEGAWKFFGNLEAFKPEQ